MRAVDGTVANFDDGDVLLVSRRPVDGETLVVEEWNGGTLINREELVVSRGMHVCIRSERPFLSLPKHRREENVKAFARCLLHTQIVESLSMSRIVTQLVEMALAWKEDLHQLWEYARHRTQELLDLVSNERVAPCFLRLVDASIVMQHTYHDDTMQQRGLFALRRYHSATSVKDIDWRTNALLCHDIKGIAVVPIRHQQFSRLYDMSFFEDSTATRYCRCAALHEGVLTLPVDAHANHIHLSILHLIATCSSLDTGAQQEPHDTIVLPFDVCHCEENIGGCVPDGTLLPYKVSLTSTSVVLSPELGSRRRRAADSTSVDDVQITNMSVSRRRHEVLRNIFPILASRLQQHGKDFVAACLHEVRARRVAREWTMEGIDAGSNLSSLGMSVLLGICLRLWAGARVRVYVGARREALVGYWHDDRFALVDPLRTSANFLQKHCAAGEGHIEIGIFIEVLAVRRWRVARVLHIITDMNVATVQLFSSKKNVNIGINSHAWRFISDTSSDLHDILRRKSAIRPITRDQSP